MTFVTDNGEVVEPETVTYHGYSVGKEVYYEIMVE
jgi:hypothetical protein